MRPPYQITPAILKWHSAIALLCGKLEGWDISRPQPELRRKNRIRSIQGSLSIEGNTLSLEQVTAVLGGKRVLGPKKDILEAQNALLAYEELDRSNVYSEKDFLRAHRVLMNGLLDGSGKWRAGDVGIQKGRKVTHVAPPAGRVPVLMRDLFKYIRIEKEASPAIVSCVFHYEMSFIHPFLDGNGRMARLWQSGLLRKQHPAFDYVPVESMVRRNQTGYYAALGAADKKGESTPFLEFMLEAIYRALLEFTEALDVGTRTGAHRLEAAAKHFGRSTFSRKDYWSHFKTISTATASRDLKKGVDKGLLRKQGDKVTATYSFKSLKAG